MKSTKDDQSWTVKKPQTQSRLANLNIGKFEFSGGSINEVSGSDVQRKSFSTLNMKEVQKKKIKVKSTRKS